MPRIAEIARCCGSKYTRWTTDGQPFPNGHEKCARCLQPLQWQSTNSPWSNDRKAVQQILPSVPEPFTFKDVEAAMERAGRPVAGTSGLLISFTKRGWLERVVHGHQAKATLYRRTAAFPKPVQTNPKPAKKRDTLPAPNRVELAWRAFKAEFETKTEEIA